ncbi:M23 family metallopeptidase [Candidatus Gracilibacteria bacterium]|nr:M23 family metallopeptidase [Candidatus Gracilibacteria bacterium]
MNNIKINMIIVHNKYIHYAIVAIWICNCILGGLIAIKQSWLPYINAGNSLYTEVKSDIFDGTIMPILYIPDWTKTEYQNKTVKFSDIPISDFIPLPNYDPIELSDTKNTTKKSTIIHYTYITPYMGSYRLNYKEYDGSHNAIDIRAPIGTPVLSIANGVVIRTIEADMTGNKLVVIRHDNVDINGKIQDIYSGYLHLSEISVQEGKKIKKGDMLGRVGMTGIATTPHLHIQIDTENAPFHPYWPFSSSDSKINGLSFFDSINAGLGRENALQYSIHPMLFIENYLNGKNIKQGTNENSIELLSAPNIPKEDLHELIPVNASVESIIEKMNLGGTSPALSKTTTQKIVSNITYSTTCEKKRFPDVSNTSKGGKILYQLIDAKCMFQNGNTFNPNATITQKDAIVMLMQYYNISPTNGTSHFLDINIGDPFQGYAVTSYRKGILDGSYAFPEKLLSKEEFIELLVKIGKFEKNPSQIKIYKDTNAMNLKFQYIQDYGFKIRARGGNFNPKSLLTRQGAVEIIGNIYSRDQLKK